MLLPRRATYIIFPPPLFFLVVDIMAGCGPGSFGNALVKSRCTFQVFSLPLDFLTIIILKYITVNCLTVP